MFSSPIHFRTNTFDILSHLADRQTTDGSIYVHVRLLTYFHNFSLRHLTPTYMICHEREAVVRRNEHFKIISYTCLFLSKVTSFLDFRFSLKCVYLFCKFQEFETLIYIFQDHLMISHCEYKNGQIGTT
jgi:hypothetical protein